MKNLIIKLKEILLYVTNNEQKKHSISVDVKFDIFFWIILFLDVFCVGIPAVILNSGRLDKLFWVIAIFIWVWEGIRNNRE